MEKKIVAPKKRHMKQCRADIIFDVVNYTLLSLLLIICLYPLIFVVRASIT